MFLVEFEDGSVGRLDAREVQSRRGKIRAFLLDEEKPAEPDREEEDDDDATEPVDLTIVARDLHDEDIVS